MKIKNTDLKKLPLTFHKAKEVEPEKIRGLNTFIAVGHITSSKVMPQHFYKPISKTISGENK